MNKKAVLYLSEAQIPFSSEDVEELYHGALNHNKEFNISGFLCFKDNFFLQYIEGEEAYIDKLFFKIRQDPRHQVLIFLEDNQLNDYRFNKWKMHLVNKTHIEDLEISFSLYEQLQMLEGHESISPNVQNLVWQGVGVVAKYHIDLP